MSASEQDRLLDLAAPGIVGLHPYVPGKPIEELERELGISDTVKLASNENPLGPSPLGLAAAREAVAGIHLYPDDLGFRLRNQLAACLGVGPAALTLGAGSSDVIDMVARSFLAPGRNAVFARHSFAMYYIYTQAAGAEGRVAAPYPADHPDMPYGHDLDALADQVNGDTRVVFIANPNNPTGTWVSSDKLERFLNQLPDHVIVVLDEAYTEYVSEPGFPDGLSLLPRFPNLIVTRTFSKIYGLAGLRVGYGISSPELAEVINRVRHPFNVNSVALAAAEAAMADRDHLSRSVDINRRGLEQLVAGFETLGLGYIPSVGNFICVDTGRPVTEVFDALLRRGCIARPVANYELPTHLRVTVGLPEQNQRLLAALKEMLIS